MISPETAPVAAISYRLKRGDVFWGMLHAVARNRFNLVFYFVLAGVMSSLAFTDAALRQETIAYKTIYLLLSVIFTLCLASIAMIVFALAMAFMRPLRGIVGAHCIELRDDGILESTDINQSLHRWSGIRRIRRTGAYLQIYVTDFMYHSIPISAFQSPHDADAFLNKIRRRTQAAQPVGRGNGGMPAASKVER